ncbi:MAG: hypothetical protein AAF950_08835 [Pseudomonadota bacterium]
MGLPMTGKALREMTAQLTPTPLLVHLAKGYAPEIAAIWPAPHHGFFALPAARRHLAAMLIDANLPLTAAMADRIAERVTFDRDGIVADPVLPNGSAGLMKILSRAGETLWLRQDYAGLLRLVRREGMTKLIRHRQIFDVDFVQVANALPDVMLKPKLIEAIPNIGTAEDVAETVEILLLYEGEVFVAALAERMDRANSPVTAMERLSDALVPDKFAPYVAPPELPTSRFQRMVSRKQLKDVALSFQNCLRDYDADIASGSTAVFLADTKPRVVLSIERDARGWMLGEANLARNEQLPVNLLREIAGDLRAAGVRVGTGLKGLQDRLHRHVCKTCGPVNYPPWPDWRTRLAGGG